jgi:hypothetical protein
VRAQSSTKKPCLLHWDTLGKILPELRVDTKTPACAVAETVPYAREMRGAQQKAVLDLSNNSSTQN